AYLVVGEARGDLDRRTVADAPRTGEVPAHIRFAVGVLRSLRDGLHVRTQAQPRAEGGSDPLVEIEVDVPELQIFGDVREVHVRAVREVIRAAQVDQAERLE